MSYNQRTVVESERFADEAAHFFGHYDLQRLLAGLDWSLAMSPERGMDTSHPFIRAVTCDLHGAIYAIYYIYDDLEVELLSIRKIA